MTLFRDMVGSALRHERVKQERTLRGISFRADVSLGYLSEIERGMKEPSSEVMNSICKALNVPLYEVLRAVADDMEMLAPQREMANA